MYSSSMNLCLPGGMRQMDSEIYGTMSLVPTVAFEILLLVLTIVKVFKNAILLRSHPSSPIVCVVFHFNLSSKLM